MYIPPQIVEEQWRNYLPFIYKFYFEHTETSYLDVICAKWCKQPKLISTQNHLSFIIAGLSKVEHQTQQYSYILQENLIKSFDLLIPSINAENENTERKFNERQQPKVIEKNRIFYQRQITSVEDICLNQKKSRDIQTSSNFYAVAIKNDSIRLINAAKLAGLQVPKRSTFLSERSPFLSKNMKATNLCPGNEMEAGTIPLEKEVTVMKFQMKEMSLLCGCTDGTIVLINLESQISLANQNPFSYCMYFTSHTHSIRDLVWLTYPSDDKLSFASVASNGEFYIWKKENSSAPVILIEDGSSQPTSLIEVYPDQLVQSGRDCLLKFFDIKKLHSYIYNESNQIITKLYNLTGLIEFQKTKKQTHMDNSLRFVACEQSGKVVFWQGQRQFEHLAHKKRIASLDFSAQNGGMFLAIQKETAKISFFSPVLFTTCLQEIND